jgi:tyrosyl-tRNA synthetase
MVTISPTDIGEWLPVFRLFALAGMAGSNGEARRLIRGGGARLNDIVVADEGVLVSAAALREGVKLSAGRKHHRLVQAG